jgi:uncharacterized protein YggT (Ycf19 family)
MAQDRTLINDDERRFEQYESAKDAARSKVQEQVKWQAEQSNQTQQSQVASLGTEFKEEAISEVQNTDVEVKRARLVARISQIIDFLFYLIYGLISLQIIFDLLGARRNNSFRSLIDVLSSPWLGPFRNLFPDPSAGRFQIRFSYVAALVIYILLHLAVNGFLRMIAHRKTAV